MKMYYGASWVRHRCSVFINLSNHPSKEWSEGQLLAARRLGGEIRDVAFPEVAPEAGLEEVRLIAEALLLRILQMNPAAMMVHGEPVLVFQLVRLSTEAGVRCFAATTKRIAEEEQTGGGVTKKTSHFEFVQFRPYQ